MRGISLQQFTIEKMNRMVVHVKELHRSHFYRDVLNLEVERVAYFSIGTRYA